MRAFWIVTLLCGLLSGCAGGMAGQQGDWARSESSLVWPRPPADPRIKLIRTVSIESLAESKAEGRRLLRWITGDELVSRPLVAPYGVVADGEGKVWLADTGGRAIHLFDLAKKDHEAWAVLGDQLLLSPVGMAIDLSARRLYVSDSVLRKVFQLSFEGELEREIVHPQGFRRPVGLGVGKEGHLLVVDALRGTVEHFNKAGKYLGSLGSSANPDGKFTLPSNVATDADGHIFVTDSMNFRIEVLDSDGRGLTTIGGIGDVPGSFARPRGVTVDSYGHIYAADAAFSNVQIFDREGHLLLFFGGPGEEPGQFSLPAGLFMDGQNRLYVVDSYNQRIQIFAYLHAAP